MPDSHLPVAAPSAAPPAPAADQGVGPAAPVPGGGRSFGTGGGVVAGGAVLAAGLLLVLGLSALGGEAVRNALLVEVDHGLTGSEPTYSDAPAEAASFFADRDSVTVRVPWDMSVGEFLALYHLETNPSARAALRDQLGALADGDPLREGDRVTLRLTLGRTEP